MHAKLVIVAETEKEKILRKEFTFDDTKVKKHILSFGLVPPEAPGKHFSITLDIDCSNLRDTGSITLASNPPSSAHEISKQISVHVGAC